MSGEGYNPAQSVNSRTAFWKKFFVWLLATIALIALILSPRVYNARHEHTTPQKRNVIFMVSDGMGPASVAMARDFLQHTTNNSQAKLALDEYLIGQSRTKSSSSFVTDSAAGATAFSCGLKTYNGAIAVDPHGDPCGTIMEAAKLAGYKTGVVVTTSVTDATPASFISHALYRSHQDSIAKQIVNMDDTQPFGAIPDIVIGGGRCHFLPNSDEESCRNDDVDVIEYAKSQGWGYTDNVEEFRNIENIQLPFLGLLTPNDFPLVIDNAYKDIPHLNETAVAAVRALEEATKDSDQGYFLVVEGSRIDHCGHSNDAGAQVREVLGYSEVFRALKEHVEDSDIPTVIVSTSDHETGGLSVALQRGKKYPEYEWKPEVLAAAKHSTEYLVEKLLAYEGPHDKLYKFIEKEILGENGLGFTDISRKDVKFIAHHMTTVQQQLTKMQSQRANVGWATHGHSAVDVNVYAFSNYPELLRPIHGGNENIEVGHFLRDMLGFTQHRLDEITNELGDALHLKATEAAETTEEYDHE